MVNWKTAIVGILISFNLKAQVDTLKITLEKGFSIYEIANYNCKPVSCYTFDESECFICNEPITPSDSILQYKTRINDSLYLKIYDTRGVMRLEYLQPHAKAIYGHVRVYNKSGQLIRKEHYSYGEYQQKTATSDFSIVGYAPFRSGIWEYYENEILVKKERYDLLHTPDKRNYYGLVKEFILFDDRQRIKWQNEYVVRIEKLEFNSKSIELKNPFYTVKAVDVENEPK